MFPHVLYTAFQLADLRAHNAMREYKTYTAKPDNTTGETNRLRHEWMRAEFNAGRIWRLYSSIDTRIPVNQAVDIATDAHAGSYTNIPQD